ncbi:sensor histidine kinase [Kocuria himachalensis]
MDRILSLLTFNTVVFHELSLRRRVVLSQLPLAATMVFLLVGIAVFHPHDLPRAGFQGAMALTALLSLLCVLVPWERLPYPSFLVIPVLDFVPITVLRESVGATLTGVGMLAVYPVIWLAASGRMPRTAVPLGAVLTLAMVWAPLLVTGTPLTVDTVTAPVLIPFMMLGIGYTVQVLDRSMEAHKAALEAQQALLQAKDARLEALLADSARRQRLLDTILDTVDVGVLAIDAAGHDILMNRRQQTIHRLGLPEGLTDAPEAQLLLFGEDGVTPMPPGDRPAARAVAGESFSNTLIRIGRPPAQRALSVTTRVMTDEQLIREGTVLSFHDVTDLVAALQAKDEFLAGVSHELRTPLTSIRGYTELLTMDEDLPGHTRNGLAVIERNAHQLSVLVEDLLGTAGGTRRLQPVPTDLVPLVVQAVSAAEPRATETGVDLRIQAPATVEVQCDPMRIGQVLDNLLSNAIKYSPHGGPVTVRITGAEDTVQVQVTDQGIGMTPEDTEQVFGRFFRSPGARMSAIPGLGLGLNIAQDIVTGHHGTLTCTSRLGQGTVFTMTLPAHIHHPSPQTDGTVLQPAAGSGETPA